MLFHQSSGWRKLKDLKEEKHLQHWLLWGIYFPFSCFSLLYSSGVQPSGHFYLFTSTSITFGHMAGITNTSSGAPPLRRSFFFLASRGGPQPTLLPSKAAAGAPPPGDVQQDRKHTHESPIWNLICVRPAHFAQSFLNFLLSTFERIAWKFLTRLFEPASLFKRSKHSFHFFKILVF